MTTTHTPNVRILATYRNRSEEFPMVAIQGNEKSLTEGQLVKAGAFGATHYFKTADMRELPKYKREALLTSGWDYIRIGHTSYVSATWGARRIA